MIPVLSADDVRRQDAEAAARGIPVDTLMRASGAAVAAAGIRMLGGAYGRHVVVACGKGNNGGDGLVAAWLLRHRGASVRLALPAGDPPENGPAGRARRAFGGAVIGAGALAEEASRADLVIDALLGVGLSRAPDGAIAGAIADLNAAAPLVLSVDVPSGLDGDTGRVPGDAIRARRTVSLGGYKPGLLTARGRALSPEVEVADIGIPEDLRGGIAWALEASDVAAMIPAREPGSNKYRTGVCLCVCGSRAMPGAAALVTAGAVQAGAGLTILAAPASVCAIAAARIPEIVTVPLGDDGEGILDEKGLEPIRKRLARASALAVGPGLSQHPVTGEVVRALVAGAAVPLVLDADGLTAFAGAAARLSARPAPTVLTPHEGEFTRLTGRPIEDRLAEARQLSADCGCVVLLKGSGTVVASPDGRVLVNSTGNAALASAGTGDVLTGILVAFLARGMDPFEAAAAAAWIHGAAGDRFAHGTPPRASEIAAAVGAVLGEIAG